MKLFTDDKKFDLADKSDVPVKVITGSLQKATGTPNDLINTSTEDAYQLAIKQDATSTNTATTLGVWSPLIGLRAFDKSFGLSVSGSTPVAKIWGGANNEVKWSDELVFKSDYDKLVQRVAALEKQIGGDTATS